MSVIGNEASCCNYCSNHYIAVTVTDNWPVTTLQKLTVFLSDLALSHRFQGAAEGDEGESWLKSKQPAAEVERVKNKGLNVYVNVGNVQELRLSVCMSGHSNLPKPLSAITTTTPMDKNISVHSCMHLVKKETEPHNPSRPGFMFLLHTRSFYRQNYTN